MNIFQWIPAPEAIRQLISDFEMLSAALSFLLNPLLIFLILNKSNSNMKAFRVVLLISSIVDMLFTAVNVVTMQTVEVRGRFLFMFNMSSQLRVASQPVGILSTCLWMAALFAIVANAPTQFYYRYHVVRYSASPTRLRFALCYSALIGYSLMQSALFALVYDYGPEAMQKYGNVLREVPIYSRLPNVLHLLNTQLIVFFCYAVVIYAGHRTWQCLRVSRAHMSAATLKAHDQVKWLMILQALYPLVFLSFPVVAVCAQVLIGVEWRGIFAIGIMGVSFIPLLNPLSVILIVPSYRRAVCAGLFGRLSSKWTDATLQQSSQHLSGVASTGRRRTLSSIRVI